MKKQKQTYEAPEAQTLVVRFEGMICVSNYGSPNAAGNPFTYSGGNIDDYSDSDF